MKRDSGRTVACLLGAVAIGFVFASVAVPACVHSNIPAPQPDVMVPPVGDAGPEPIDPAEDDCAVDCRAWRAQGCPEGNPTAAGTTCEAVCRNTARAGIDTAHQLSCATTATSCAQHRACPY